MFDKIVPKKEYLKWKHSFNLEDITGIEGDRKLYLILKAFNNQWVVSYYNSETDGYFWGHYHDSYSTAFDNFCNIKSEIRKRVN